MTDLDAFVQSMLTLRGKEQPRDLRLVEEVATCLRWNVMQAHTAVLGYPTWEVEGSEYRTLGRPEAHLPFPGLSSVRVRVMMGGLAERALANTPLDRRAHKTRLLIEGPERLRYWPEDYRFKSQPMLGELAVDTTRMVLRKPERWRGALNRTAFPREAAVHWLEPEDVKTGRYDPALVLNVRGLFNFLTDPRDDSLHDVRQRAAYVVEYLSSFAVSFAAPLEVRGWSGANDMADGAMCGVAPRYPATGRDYDLDRVTLHIQATTDVQGDAVDFLGRHLNGSEAPTFLLDII